MLLSVPKFGRVQGDALPQPVPDQPVEDGRRSLRAPARRARRAARAAEPAAGPVGRLFVISGPSGAGKGTLISGLLERIRSLRVAISATTRAAPAGRGRRPRVPLPQRRGVPARASTAASSSSTSATPAGATARCAAEVDRLLATGQGRDPRARDRRRVRRAPPQTGRHARLHRPPSFDDLERRLRARATDSAGEIESRLAIAREQLRERGPVRHRDRQRRRERATGELQQRLDALLDADSVKGTE